jgi:tyrocidine synthetase-3
MTYDREFSNKAAIAAVQYGREGEYWLKKFSGEVQKTSFPCDRRGSFAGSRVMDSVTFELSNTCVSKLMELSKGLDHRLYIILAAVLTVLLHRYTGNNDIIIGSPIFRQGKEEDFLNTVLALRNQVDDCKTFKELLLDRVRQTIAEASEHQNYPIETLLFKLNMAFTNEEFSLFDVVILLENIHEKKYIRHIHPNVIFSFLRTNSSIEGVLEYNSYRYEKATAGRIVRHFTRLIEEVVLNIDIPVSHIDILSEEEKRQLLVDFNDTGAAYPAEKTIHELFEEQCCKKPAAVAVTYEGEPFTYKEVNEKAGRLASYLCSIGVKPAEPVAIAIEDSPLVVAGILGILKAGGVYLPTALDSPHERKKYILADCNVNVLLTNGEKSFDHVSRVIDLEDGEVYKNPGTFSWKGTGSDPAYIIYTSGSTGAPKGVMVNHRNVVRLVKAANYVEFNEGDSILLTGALDFDASTFEIWGALLNGLTLHLVSKDTILNYEKLKEAIRERGVSTMWMTSPLFNQVSDIDIEVFAGLTNLLVGGDVLSPPHINRLRHRFPGIKVINGYGPTENTTFSLAFPIDKDYQENIPIGRPISNSTAYIFDYRLYLVPIGVPGELYVGGDGLSRGYLNNPELTAERFLPGNYRSYRSYRTYITGKLYKTGDRARWLPDGNIEFLGRIDSQVKIRGYRIEPGEIESRLLRIDGIGNAVVIDRESKDGEKFLCAYITAEDSRKRNQGAIDVGEVKRQLLEHLPDYMVPAYFVQLDELPLKAMGKVDRDALPEPEAGDIRTAYVPPRNPLEKKLVEIWSGVLGVEEESIGIDSDFFELGGHSLKATMLISKIHKALDVKVPLAELFRTPTIRELGGFISTTSVKGRHISIESAEKKEYYPLSSAQKRLYVVQQIEPESTAYNMPQIISLDMLPAIDLKELEDVVGQLIKLHESFRTSFHMINEEPVQRIHDEVKFEIEFYNLATEDTENTEKREEIQNSFVRPFDLARPPLLRVGVFKTGEEGCRLIVDIHHIISDGVSQDIMMKDFISLNSKKELPPLRLQYKDYAQWQNRQFDSGKIKTQEEYWLERFKGPIPILNLPVDYPRTDTLNLSGGVYFKTHKELSGKIKQLTAQTGSTMFIFLLSVYTILLSKYANQEDIVVGCTIANRTHEDLNHIIGMFVNLVAMRNFHASRKTFRQFLEEVKTNSIAAFENQDYQFEELVGKLGIPRDPYRNPLTDVVFAMQNFSSRVYRDSQAPMVPDEIWEDEGEQSTGVAKFDITLGALEIGDIILLHFDYRKNLFKKETIKQMCGHLLNIIDEVTTNPDIKVSGIKMVKQAEMEELKNVIVNKSREYDTAVPIPAGPSKIKMEAEFGF